MDAKGKLITELKSAGRDATELLSQAVIPDEQWRRIGLVCIFPPQCRLVTLAHLRIVATIALRGLPNG